MLRRELKIITLIAGTLVQVRVYIQDWTGAHMFDVSTGSWKLTSGSEAVE